MATATPRMSRLHSLPCQVGLIMGTAQYQGFFAKARSVRRAGQIRSRWQVPYHAEVQAARKQVEEDLDADDDDGAKWHGRRTLTRDGVRQYSRVPLTVREDRGSMNSWRGAALSCNRGCSQPS